MNAQPLTKKTLCDWLQNELTPYGETVGPHFGNSCNVVVMDGEEGQRHSAHSTGDIFISFESSALYDLLNGTFSWSFHTKFTDFLAEMGAGWEMGHSWNANIYNELRS